MDVYCDLKENTPADYSLMVWGLPKIKEDEIKQFFEVDFKESEQIYIRNKNREGNKEIVDLIELKINFVFDLSKKQDLLV